MPAEADFPTKLRPWWHPLSLAGGLVVGQYPRDKNLRKAGVVAIALAVVAILGQSLRASSLTTHELLRASEVRTDRMLEVYRQDTREQIAATRELGVSVAKLAAETTEIRRALMEEQRPRPRPPRIGPVGPSR